MNKISLAEHYENLYSSSIGKIKSGDYERDLLIDSPTDKRLGISLLIRPTDEIRNQIQPFLAKLKEIDSFQNYYPRTDIHITVMSIISCYEGFQIEKISVADYVDLIHKSIEEIGEFSMEFKGITASGSGVMISGFPEDKTLHELRNNLRFRFKNSTLEQSIDKRYSIQTAHATVVRFRRELQNANRFIEIMENYKNYRFGTFKVNELELVCNDWYQREKNTTLLQKFRL